MPKLTDLRWLKRIGSSSLRLTDSSLLMPIDLSWLKRTHWRLLKLIDSNLQMQTGYYLLK